MTAKYLHFIITVSVSLQQPFTTETICIVFILMSICIPYAGGSGRCDVNTNRDVLTSHPSWCRGNAVRTLACWHYNSILLKDNMTKPKVNVTQFPFCSPSDSISKQNYQITLTMKNRKCLDFRLLYSFDGLCSKHLFCFKSVFICMWFHPIESKCPPVCKVCVFVSTFAAKVYFFISYKWKPKPIFKVLNAPNTLVIGFKRKPWTQNKAELQLQSNGSTRQSNKCCATISLMSLHSSGSLFSLCASHQHGRPDNSQRLRQCLSSDRSPRDQS